MSGFGTNGQNGSAFGTNTGPSLFGSGGPTPNSNASQSQQSTTPETSVVAGFAAARRQQPAQASAQSLFGAPAPGGLPATSSTGSTPSLFGASGPLPTTASTSGGLFGPTPVLPATGTTSTSITSGRGSVFGAGASAKTNLPTGGGLFGGRPVSTTTTPAATGSGLFGSAPVQGGLGAATATTSSSAAGSSLFGSAPAAAAPTSTGSGLFGSTPVTGAPTSTSSGLFGSTAASTTATSTTAAGLFGTTPTTGTGASTTGSSSSSALNQSETITTEPTPTGSSSGDTPPTMATASDASDATGTNETEGSVSPKRSVINIDTDGDLLLDVAGDEDSGSSQPQRLRVCSSTLRRHSPVWKQMLFGPWKESKPANAESEEWIVELPDDPVNPMQIVLNIIHGRFNQVPHSLSLDELHKLLILTNKYDMTDILRPWCAQWTAVAHGDLSSADTLKSLFIAWELGDEHLFALRIEEISINTTVNTSFKWKSLFSQVETRFSKKSVLAGTPDAGNPEWIDLEGQDYLGPHDILDIVRAIRCEALSMIITPLDKDMSTRRIPGFSTACSGSQKFNSALGSAALCDAATLGGLTIHIDHRFTNLTTLPYIKESVVQVASGVFPKIGRIEVLPQHPQCSLHTKYATLGKKIHEDLPGLVARYIKPGHKKYMENQRNKTGIELSRAGQKQRQAITRRYW